MTRGRTVGFKKHIKALKSHRASAFESIYETTKHAVFAMAISVIKDRQYAEDIMQESYMKMVKNIEQYDPNQSFMNWLLTITKHTAIDYYHNMKHEIAIDPTDGSALFSSKDTPIEKRLEAEYYLSMLDDDSLQVVMLKIVADLTFKDIAELLEKPIGTITWIYYEAMKKMQHADRVTVYEKATN